MRSAGEALISKETMPATLSSRCTASSDSALSSLLRVEAAFEHTLPSASETAFLTPSVSSCFFCFSSSAARRCAARACVSDRYRPATKANGSANSDANNASAVSESGDGGKGPRATEAVGAAKRDAPNLSADTGEEASSAADSEYAPHPSFAAASVHAEAAAVPADEGVVVVPHGSASEGEEGSEEE